MQKNNIPEEETITPVIKDIERIFIRIFNSIGRAISTIGIYISRIISFFLTNFKKLVLVAIIGGILGFLSFYIAPKQYASDLVVKMNIDARAQLFSDVNYFNSLVKRDQSDRLANLLNLTESEAKSITAFEVLPFSSLRERIEYVDKIYRNLDTSYQKLISVDDILDEEDYSYSNKFIIIVKSEDEFVFEKIETPFLKYIERVPELHQMRESQLKILENERAILTNEMESLDTLKKITNLVMLEQAKAKSKSNTGTTITMGQNGENSNINPLDVYAKVVDYSKQISIIDTEIENYNQCYIIFSHFNTIGDRIGFGKIARSLLFAITFFFLTALIVAFREAYKGK